MVVGVLSVEVADDSNTLQSSTSEPAPLLPPRGIGGTDDDDDDQPPPVPPPLAPADISLTTTTALLYSVEYVVTVTIKIC